jgi:hypothetical protein
MHADMESVRKVRFDELDRHFAEAFFFALSGAFSLYALTWWTCAAIRQTLSPIQWPKVLHASHRTSFLYLHGER